MVIYSRSPVQHFDNCGSVLWKTDALLNLISQYDDTNKIYLYANDLSEPKYEFLIK